MKVHATIRYDKRQRIGVGQGMNSAVYLAHDPHLNREIAVKEIERSQIAGTGWDAYHREAQAMLASRHENVVPILYACLTPSQVCLAMPYYPRGSLQDRIGSGPPPLHDAYRIADGVLGALSQIHVAKVLHFDLKPSNILFSETDEPMIADFGQARLIDPSGLAAAPKMYKWGIPPEVLSNHVGIVESDIYQAGLTLYRLFNGDPHFKRQCSRHTASWADAIQKGRLPDRGDFLPHISPGIRRVIRKALKVDPTQRYHSAIEFQDALSRLELPLNWTVHLNSAFQITWTARRDKGRDLEVGQFFDTATGCWRVEVHTLNGGCRRRKGVDRLWADNLDTRAVDDHLKEVFSDLG